MTFLADNVLDNGVSYASTNVDRLDICSQEPTTYTEATSTYTLGDKNNPTMNGPQDRTGGGREVEMASFSDGDVTSTGTASHFAWSYTGGTELIATEALSSSQSVTSGNTFSLTAHSVGIPDAA